MKMSVMKYSDPSDKPYFYGRLLREEANRILEKNGCIDGMFLLRESVFEVGSYILSLCCNRTIQHYKIDRQEDGSVAIRSSNNSNSISKAFVGPVELIKYHQNEASGLVTRPNLPCNRSDDENLQPIKYLFIHDVDFYKLVNAEIINQLSTKYRNDKLMTKQEYEQELEEAKGRYRYKYEKIVLKNIHFTQAWFVDNSSREDATRLLHESGIEDGKFLVRRNNKSINSSSSSNSNFNNNNNNNNNSENVNPSEYKISLCFKGEVKHYQIKTRFYFMNEEDSNNNNNGGIEARYFIDDSFEFDTIIQLIDYFHRCSVGFLCNLHIAYLPMNKSQNQIFENGLSKLFFINFPCFFLID
jgi:hypothetical protein